MNILSLSTAEKGCSIALADETGLLFKEFWSSALTHSKRLPVMLDHLFEERSPVPLDLVDAFVSAKGPGSFTGVRIGISTVQGMANATGKPALGVSSLDGIAWQFAFMNVPVCAMMDARRNEVYYCVYRFKNGRLDQKGPERVAKAESAVQAAGKNAVFAGSGSKAYLKEIEKQIDHPLISHPFQDHVDAGCLIQALMGKNDFLEDPEYLLVPNYIRRSDAEMQFIEK